jgi:H+/gluconate symporter-like permease
VRPELLVLATGTGSLILSHVNDPGFWMIQSFFKLEVKETLATWTVLETVLSVAGLGTTLLLAAVPDRGTRLCWSVCIISACATMRR